MAHSDPCTGQCLFDWLGLVRSRQPGLSPILRHRIAPGLLQDTFDRLADRLTLLHRFTKLVARHYNRRDSLLWSQPNPAQRPLQGWVHHEKNGKIGHHSTSHDHLRRWRRPRSLSHCCQQHCRQARRIAESTSCKNDRPYFPWSPDQAGACPSQQCTDWYPQHRQQEKRPPISKNRGERGTSIALLTRAVLRTCKILK